MTRPPKDCATMAELRVEIDRIDAALIDLLVTRAGYIDRAIELKPGENLPARTEDRVAQVITNVRSLAEARDLDPALAEELWRALIDWSIRREQKVID